MPVRNGYKSHNGRSGVARKVLRGGAGNVNGMMPQKEVWTVNAGYVPGNTYFGGPKKGGLAPTATGFMRPNGVARRGPRGTANYLFQFAGYSAQKGTSECTGNCALGLDYLVKNIWSWSFFMDETAKNTYRNTDIIEPSVSASFIVDKVSFFTKSNLSPAPSNSGLDWLHSVSQDRYVLSFSDDNNHNFDDKAPGILIGDRLYFAIGSNHGWEPAIQWNTGEFFDGLPSSITHNESVFNGNIVWSRPLVRTSLKNRSKSRAFTLKNQEGYGPVNLPRYPDNSFDSNTQTLYQYINQPEAPLSDWDSNLVGNPYQLDVAGYYGNGTGGDAGSMPIIDKIINGKNVLGISPVYNILYITFAEFNVCGKFYLVLDGYYANWEKDGKQTIKPEFITDLREWKSQADPWGRTKQLFMSIGGPQFQPATAYRPGVSQPWVANYEPYGPIPPINSPQPAECPEGNGYPSSEMLITGIGPFLGIGIADMDVFDGIDNFFTGDSRYWMGDLSNALKWRSLYTWLNEQNKLVQLSAYADKRALLDYNLFLGPPNFLEYKYKFNRFGLKFFNSIPASVVGYELINSPMHWIDSDGITHESSVFVWNGWSNNGTPKNWQVYGTGDYSTMPAWEYCLRIINMQDFTPANDINAAILIVPASPNSASPVSGVDNEWDYNLLAKQIFVQGTEAGLQNAVMREMRENKPIKNVCTWCIENDASLSSNFIFTNVMEALLNGTVPSQNLLLSTGIEPCDDGYRVECGWKWDCKGYSYKPNEQWLIENDAVINYRSEINTPEGQVKLAKQREYAQNTCSGGYNKPYVGTNVLCNGTPIYYWGDINGEVNGGNIYLDTYLWWRCQPGDECR